jgi:putative transposase
VVHPNPKGVIIPDGKDTLKGVPELGQIKVPGLDKRWRNPDGSRPAIATFKICWCPSGWYVQLTGELERSQGLKNCNQAIAGDPGLLNYITFDNGTHVENPRFWRKQEEKLGQLQQQLAHKRSHNLILWLNHPDRTIDDIRNVININPDDAQALLHVKTEQEGKQIVNQSRWSRLMFKRGEESKAIQQLVKRIKQQHESIKRMRRAFSHRLSTWLVRNHTVFVCEDGLQKEQLRHRAGIKLDENDVAQKNNKKAKAGLTKSLSDAAHGQLMELCAQKFKEAGRVFIRYPARNTTLECPICGTDNQMEANHEGQLYHCSYCSWHEAGRDQKPGILMIMRLMETIDSKLLVSCDRYKDKTALDSLIKQHRGLVTMEMVSTEVKSAIVFQQNWIARTGGCSKSKTRKKRSKLDNA